MHRASIGSDPDLSRSKQCLASHTACRARVGPAPWCLLALPAYPGALTQSLARSAARDSPAGTPGRLTTPPPLPLLLLPLPPPSSTRRP